MPRQDHLRDARLEQAIQAVSDGASYSAAARVFCVTQSHIYKFKVRGGFTRLRRGRNPLLSESDEQVIVELLIPRARMGHPCSNRHLMEAIKSMVDAMPPARRQQLRIDHDGNYMPSSRYLRSFRHRHKDQLSFAKPACQENKSFGL